MLALHGKQARYSKSASFVQLNFSFIHLNFPFLLHLHSTFFLSFAPSVGHQKPQSMWFLLVLKAYDVYKVHKHG